MAKKTRRVRKPTTSTTNAAYQVDGSDSKTRLSSAEQFILEYAYVIKDLRHILILAAVMFTLLIIANLILQ